MPIESLFPSLNEALMPYFKYQTAKYILIEVPVVGIVHRLCQLGALVYVVLNMYYGNGWAMATVPMGSVNAWAEVGGYMQAAQSTHPFSSVAYCSNPSTRTIMVESGSTAPRRRLPPATRHTGTR